MEQWKPEQVRKIWQRVQSQNRTAADNDPTLSELFLAEWQDSRLLFRLSEYFRGKNGQRLRQIAREDQVHANTLKRTRLDPDARVHSGGPQPLPKIHPKLLLQQCYERKLKRLSVYQHRQSDPLFKNLAWQEQQHCNILLAILDGRTG